MTYRRWTFFDPLDSDTYTFEISPNDGGSPEYAKNITYAATTAPNGALLMFEGRAQQQTYSFSGTLLSEDQYNAMLTWFNKRHQVQVTDDLDRTFWIYIVKFSPKRVRAAGAPWKHTYQVDCVILDWPIVP